MPEALDNPTAGGQLPARLDFDDLARRVIEAASQAAAERLMLRAGEALARRGAGNAKP